jgi:uncharacterized glyoxalase superfamily protein PhnB
MAGRSCSVRAATLEPVSSSPYIFRPPKVDELHKRGIANGATSNMDPQDKEYGRAAGFLDKWGNQWWLNSPDYDPS